MLRKLAIMTAGAVLATGAFGTATASAAGNYACVLDPNVVAQFVPPVGLPPAGGVYDFVGHVTCTTDRDGPFTVRIESQGNYDNIICGTLRMYNGVARIALVPAVNLRYHVDFFGMVGVLVIDAIRHAPAVTFGTAIGGGVLQLRPKTGDCQTGISEFFLSGGFDVGHVTAATD